MRTLRSWLRGGLMVALAGCCISTPPVMARYVVLHSFTNGSGNGASPAGSLTLSDSTLYGMTAAGGATSNGVIFKIGLDGKTYANLHEFSGGTDGAKPYGSLTADGNVLYGMTSAGGVTSSGVIFRINMDGTGYTNLHEFVGGVGDGAVPYGSLTLASNTLYGMTSAGGVSNCGVVFRLNADGTDYTNLHEFLGVSSIQTPGMYVSYGSPVFSYTTVTPVTTNRLISLGSGVLAATNGGMLTALGYVGTNTSITTDSVTTASTTNNPDLSSSATNVTIAIDVPVSDGAGPMGSLTLSGSTLYGMTKAGGDYSSGVIFKINTDGTGYALLHTNSYWGGGRGELLLSDSMFYGMNEYGGGDRGGEVFSIDVTGTNYASIHSYGGTPDGGNPRGSLIQSGTNFYGMTKSGGQDDNETFGFAGRTCWSPSYWQQGWNGANAYSGAGFLRLTVLPELAWEDSLR